MASRCSGLSRDRSSTASLLPRGERRASRRGRIILGPPYGRLRQQIAESDASVSCFPEDGKTYEELDISAIRKIMSPPDEMAAYLYPTSEGSLRVAATNIMPPFFSHASASAKG